MSLNCRLNRNISLIQPGESGDGCEGQDISMGVGGLRSPVLVYNISDVPSLKFENDNRADDSLTVDTINSQGQFYKIDFTSASYNEEYGNHKWTHTLTLEIANITPLFEDLLSDGVNGRYLVCFKPNGSEDYRMFGWKYGATLDYSLNINSDSLGYTVTLEDVSEYPLFSVYADNFGSDSKVYTPIFKPIWDVWLCEQDLNGKHTGYAIAMYVVKVNAAGQPLGSDNKLCQWTGKKQDAYKYNRVVSDGGYNIIGTYNKDATFDGRPVKIFDTEKCSADVDNSIYINQKKNELISLNSTISSSTFTITSTDDWTMISEPQYVTISPTSGHNGNTSCSVSHNGVGGIDYIKFVNVVTHEVVTLEVIVNLLKIGREYRYPHSTTDIVLTPIVQGCNTAFTYSITPSVTSSVDAGGNIHITFPNTDNELEYTMTTTHSCDSNEVKVTKIYRDGINNEPEWILSDDYCEVVNNTYTGYRIKIYTDYNPSSSTYMTTKTEKTADAECNEASPIWSITSEYCEKNADGTNTGYYIVVQTDLNEKSSTYGRTRETRTSDTEHCPPIDDDPDWVLDGDFDPYCEKKIYEPSMVEGNTGRVIFQMRDYNVYSPTYNQTIESALTESEWTVELQSMFGDFPCEAPDNDPDVEEITRYCETEEVGGTIQYTGYAVITGLDKNPYSSTYLQTVTIKELDGSCGGGSSCSCNDLVTADEPTPPTPTCSCSDLQTADSPTPPTPTSYWDTGLPVVIINTPIPTTAITKETWVSGSTLQIYTDRNTKVYDSEALEIRGRGNSSWTDPKKPYALRLESKAEILGMARSKRWVLLSNYADRTLMRNRIVNEIAQCTDLSTGMGWSPIGQYVELVLNGTHQGNYYLSEQIRVESNRVDIDEYSDCLYEIDRYDMDENYTFRSAIKNFPYHIKSPDEPNVTYFKGKIDTIETLLRNGSGYRDYIDYNSFADYWIIEELCQNFETRDTTVDPGSVWCYWESDSSVGKLKMGPPWDFDYSTFNLYWPLKANGSYCSGTTVPANGYMPNTLILTCKLYYDTLFNDSEFRAVVKQRWNAIKSSLSNIANRFDYWYNTLYTSEQLNRALWPLPGDLAPAHYPDIYMTFLEAKNTAKQFYNARMTYLDGVINGL